MHLGVLLIGRFIPQSATIRQTAMPQLWSFGFLCQTILALRIPDQNQYALSPQSSFPLHDSRRDTLLRACPPGSGDSRGAPMLAHNLCSSRPPPKGSYPSSRLLYRFLGWCMRPARAVLVDPHNPWKRQEFQGGAQIPNVICRDVPRLHGCS